MVSTRLSLKDMTLEQLEKWCQDRRHPSYRARQLWRWMYRANQRELEEMRNLPAAFRAQLARETSLDAVYPEEVFREGKSGSVKAVLKLNDGVRIEAAALRYRFGYTACLSSQAGCRMACVFCASGNSWERDLSSGEIVDQVLRLTELVNEPMSRVVLMGVGEPLDNYSQVLKALRQLHEEEGLHMSYRHMTISTCGLVPEMRRLAEEGMPVNLAISLHGVDDDTRKLLLPVAARRFSLPAVLDAAEHYAETSGRRITFEYALIKGVNDSDEAARKLAGYVKTLRGHLNLIPLNPVAECELEPTPRERARRFLEIVRAQGVAATMRRSLGVSIDAACGQLRQV